MGEHKDTSSKGCQNLYGKYLCKLERQWKPQIYDFSLKSLTINEKKHYEIHLAPKNWESTFCT